MTTTTGGEPGAQAEFFAHAMYMVDVRGWPDHLIHPQEPFDDPRAAPAGAQVTVGRIDPAGAVPIPAPAEVVLATSDFSLRNSGNRTLGAPKRSWKVELDQGPGPDGEVAGMTCLNLKSMWNDPSQMRESLAWGLFAAAGVPSSGHTYARLAINGRYLGLYSVIEQVDKAFFAQRFAGRPRGNLYKVGCGLSGCGTLEYRMATDGDDSGTQYRNPDDGSGLETDATYRLRSYSKADDAESFDDLAALIRAINGIGLPSAAGSGPERFGTDAFAERVRSILDVEAFLRWAAVNVLVGGWDNYFATPGNYYLYNSTRTPGSRDVIGEPFFTFIPWDYDNTFGMDYFGARWQDTDLLDWPANTEAYWRANSGRSKRSRLPLLQNLLLHNDFRSYYLSQVTALLDTVFNPAAIETSLSALWPRVSASAYLESDTPHGAPFTFRQYTNDEVYRNAFLQWEIRHGQTFAHGIRHYVLMRYDRARAQLKDL